MGLPPDMRADDIAERAAALTGLTAGELRSVLELCVSRHNAKRIDPGADPARRPPCVSCCTALRLEQCVARYM